MTHDEKKAALVAAGYVFEEHDDWYWFIEVTAPDEWQYQIQPLRPVNAPVGKYYAEAMNELIDKAYASYQREQELVALRRLAIDVSRIGGSGYGFNYMNRVKQSALATIQQFNITDDLTHEDVADLRHNRLYDDDESSETDE